MYKLPAISFAIFGALGLAIIYIVATFAPTPVPAQLFGRSEEIIDVGYKIYYQTDDLVFTDDRQNFIHPSKEFRNLLNGATVSAFVIPIDAVDKDTMYLSSYKHEFNQEGTVDACTSLNRIYAYNAKNGQARVIYEETSREGSPINFDTCRILRLVGRQGNNLVLLLDDPVNSPGPCTNVWTDYSARMVSLNLKSVSPKLETFAVPLSKIGQGRKEQERCLRELSV